jgi:hypothetical protein
MKLLDSAPHLLEVVYAGIPPRRLPNALHGRQEQGHEQADDRDHGKHLDERQAAAVGGRLHGGEKGDAALFGD